MSNPDPSFNSDPSAVQGWNAGDSQRDPVACPFCDQSFVVRIDLEAHMLAAHGVADKTKAKKAKATKTKRAHYNPTSQATSFRAAFVAFIVVLAIGAVVVSIANPSAAKVIVPAVIIIDVAIYFGLVRR